MLQGRRYLDLLAKAVDIDLRAEVWRQKLDDHAASEGQFGGHEHMAHAPTVDLLFDPVGLCQRLSQLVAQFGHLGSQRLNPGGKRYFFLRRETTTEGCNLSHTIEAPA